MKLINEPWKKWLWAALLGLLAIYLMRGPTAEWREDVQLSDGRIIEITQQRRYETVYDGHGIGRVVREAWLRFTLPETGNEEVVWHENLIPMRLDVYQGKPFIVAYPPTGLEFDKYGKPKPSYLGFYYVGGDWQQIPYRDIPESQYDANLVIGEYQEENIKKLTIPKKNSKKFNGYNDIYGPFKRVDPKMGENF